MPGRQFAYDHEGIVGRIQEVLFRLGTTPGDVAENLRVFGVRGHRHSPESCPVNRYLETKVTGIFTTNCGSTEWSPAKGAPAQDCAFVTLPKAVARFITEFDEGYHPDLVEDLHQLRRQA